MWGSNALGQLGLGKGILFVEKPVPLDLPDVIFTNVATGAYHTVAVDQLNRVWSFGWGNLACHHQNTLFTKLIENIRGVQCCLGIHGQLGNNSIENAFTPKPIDIKEKIVSVSAGHSHTAFLTCFGKVLISGCNHFSQLGLGIPEQKIKVPTMIGSLPAGTLIRLVDCGTSSTVSLHYVFTL